MKILSYEYTDHVDKYWHFPRVEFQKVNLLVGDTGTGKTRFLNTLFNLGTFAANKNNPLRTGTWDIKVYQNNMTYRWFLSIDLIPEKGPSITEEYIWKIFPDGMENLIIERNKEKFLFAGTQIPKLPTNQTSIVLFAEEDSIKPIHEGFSTISRRRFSQDELEKISTYSPVPSVLTDLGEREMEKIGMTFDAPLNLRLFLYKQKLPDVYNRICNAFMEFFPFVEKVDIFNITEIHKEFDSNLLIPVFCIKEKGISNWIELKELSSGMQKVLLMLSDMFIFPADGAVYLIDEYENSLGINTINFLPTVLYEYDLSEEIQFIITSHHPYIINKIPVRNWLVFNRVGGEVTIRFGDELIRQLGRSNQEAFIKLINDPLFSKGVENIE